MYSTPFCVKALNFAMMFCTKTGEMGCQAVKKFILGFAVFSETDSQMA